MGKHTHSIVNPGTDTPVAAIQVLTIHRRALLEEFNNQDPPIPYESHYLKDSENVCRFELFSVWSEELLYLLDILRRRQIPYRCTYRENQVYCGFKTDPIGYMTKKEGFPGSQYDWDNQLAIQKQIQLLKLISE